MTRSLKTLAIAAALAAGLAAAPVLLAQDQPPAGDRAPSAQGQGGMMGGGMPMMQMMQRMSRMMDSCEKMMGGMMQQHGPGQPNAPQQQAPTHPERKG